MNRSIKTIHEGLVLALLLSLSFSKAIPNVVVGALLLVFLINRERRLAINHIFLSFGALLVYLLVKSFLNGSFEADSTILSRFLIALVVPLLLFPAGKIKIMLFTLFSVVVAMAISLWNTIEYYIQQKEIPFSNGQVVNTILILERPYLGFFCLLGFVACFFLMPKYPKQKKLLILLSIAILCFIVLIAARLSLVSIMLILLLYLFFFSKFSIVKKGMIVASGVLFGVIVLFSYKNIATRFLTNTSLEKLNRYDPRIDIWDCAYGITQTDNFHWLSGCKSFEAIDNDLVECYKTKSSYDLGRRSWFIETKFNTHNQFIDFYLIGGVLALLLFVVLLYFMFKVAARDFYLLSIVLSLTLFFIFENVFHRQLGCYLIAIIFSILLNDEKKVIPIDDNIKNG